MVSVLISVVSNTESTHGQSADESRKAVFALFKKLKVCLKEMQQEVFINCVYFDVEVKNSTSFPGSLC